MDNKHLTSTNVSFHFLKNSSDFLNLVLNNISCSVLLLDKNMELQAFNDPLKTMFINTQDENLKYVRCGEAIGCAYTVEEMKRCGETSKCKLCELRIKAMQTYVDHNPIYREKLSREFYNTDGERKLKHLQFSIIPFYFQKDYYLILLVEEISELIELKNKIYEN